MEFALHRAGLLVLLASVCTFVSAAENGPAVPRKWALLVAVDRYAELSPLKFCGHDMQLLRERLIAAGFRAENVVLLRDGAEQSALQPFKSNVERHLDGVLRAAGPEDLVLVAFSGHGVQIDKAGYFCPVEARLDGPRDGLLSLDAVYEQLAACPARQKLLVVDSCRNDPRRPGERTAGKTSANAAGFVEALERAPEGILVISSCKAGQVSVEDEKLGHGVFLHFLLKGLEGEADKDGGNGNGRISLLELYRYASQKTKSFVARSREQVQTPVLRGEISGDFELARIPARPAEVEAAWKSVIEKADEHYAASPMLQAIQRKYSRMLGITAERMSQFHPTTDAQRQRASAASREAITRWVRRPEAIVLSNPSLIAANHPAALLALQRAYAFGVQADWDGTITAAEEALRWEPDNRFARLLRGMACAEKNGSSRAAAMSSNYENLPTRILRMYEFARQNPQYLHAYKDLVLELKKADPEIVGKLEEAQGNPERVREAIQRAIARLRSSDWLGRAMDDYRGLGLGIPVIVTQGAALTVGEKTVGFVAGNMEYWEARKIDGNWIWLEPGDSSGRPSGWVGSDKVNVLPFFGQFQQVTSY